MGLLSQGSPLSWEETKRHADHVRRHGILQFLHIYHAVKDRHKDVLKWGDEVSARDPVSPGLPCQATPRRLCSARPHLPPWPWFLGHTAVRVPHCALRVPGRLPARERRRLLLGVQNCPGRGARF